MKYAFRFFVLAVLAAVALTSRAQEVKITGYQPGEFAVKNGIEQQLNTNVVKKIGSTMTHATGEDLRIFVMGHADKTGSGAENDRIALARAEQVKEFLSEQFPKATITNLTKGDEANARMVTISWKITAATTTQSKEPNPGVLLIVFVILVIGATLYAIRTTRRRKAAPSVQLAPAQVVEAIPIATKPATSEIVSVEKDGNIYDVPIELKNGMWHTPFPSVKYPTEVEFRKDPRDAAKIVKSYMADKKGFHASTIKQLIANGTIKMVQQGESS